jgi:mRNA interferase MazF
VFEAGNVVLAKVQFVDSGEVKQRPALVLFEEMGNIVVAGITSNTKMTGVPLTKKDGAVKDSVIKLNYIFTISQNAVVRVLFSISPEKKKEVRAAFLKRLGALEK